MIFRLTSGVQRHLLSFPETGMGCQSIEARGHNMPSKERHSVFNREVFSTHTSLSLSTKSND